MRIKDIKNKSKTSIMCYKIDKKCFCTLREKERNVTSRKVTQTTGLCSSEIYQVLLVKSDYLYGFDPLMILIDRYI